MRIIKKMAYKIDSSIEKIIFKVISSFEVIGNKLIDGLDYFCEWFCDLSFYLISKLCKFFEDNIYTISRYLSYPTNKLIVRLWEWHIKNRNAPNPLHVEGVHYIFGPPGAGKSSWSKHDAEERAIKTGKNAYFTHHIEKPKIDENLNTYVHHRVIDIKSYYENKVKIKRYNTEKYPTLYIDEFQILNNNRLNKQKDYNDFFIPFLNDLISVRHLDFDNIYLLSQIPSNDIQIMTMLAGYHELSMKKGVLYSDWLKTGKFRIRPIYFKIKSFKIDQITNKKYHVKTQKIMINLDFLEDFESLSMRAANLKLKPDFK